MPGWKIIGIVVKEACFGANTIPKANKMMQFFWPYLYAAFNIADSQSWLEIASKWGKLILAKISNQSALWNLYMSIQYLTESGSY